MNDVRYVWFDLDDTLLDHKGAESRALAALWEAHPHIFGDAAHGDILTAYAQVNRRVWSEYAAGKRTKDGAKYGRFELLIDDVNPSAAPHAAALADEYLRLYAQHWSWVDGAGDALMRIAARVPVGLMTNGFTEVQRAKLRQFPELGQACAHIVVSEEVGVLKPDVRLFRHAEQLCGHTAHNLLYVGDSLTSDVAGGLGAGWQVAWYRGDEHDSPQVWSFHDWTELAERLGCVRA